MINKILALLLCCLVTQAQASTIDALQTWLKNPTTTLDGLVVSQHENYWLLEDRGDLGGFVQFWPQHKTCVSYAPHRFFDELTADIAEAVAKQHCQLWVTNTKHRYSKQSSGEIRDYSILTKGLPYHITLAYSHWKSAAKIYQFHGFSKEKRKTKEGRDSDVILSLGHRGNNLALNTLQQCLTQLGYKVLKYPNEVSELGGTKNALAQHFQQRDQFFHIELSKELRTALVSNGSLMERFVLCFKP